MGCRWCVVVLLVACHPGKGEDTDPEGSDIGASMVDADGDGYVQADDCDDRDDSIHPGAEDVCDGVDQDCDGEIDEDAADRVSWYTDADGDGFGDDTKIHQGCVVPPGGAPGGGDCDDADAAVSPDADEVRGNAVDEDCDGVVEPNLPVVSTADCSLSEHVVDPGGEVQLRVISAYEGATDPVTVHIETSQPTWLVLVSAVGVSWEVSEAVPGTIQGIDYNNSDETSTVHAPSGVGVRTTEWVGGPSDWDDHHTRDLIQHAEDETSLSMASFHGCYAMGQITLSEGVSFPSYPEYPDCSNEPASSGVSSGPDPSAISAVPGCAPILKESTYCLGSTSRGTELVGLDSGESCVVTSSSLSSYTLTWQDEYLYACVGLYNQLMRLDLTSGFIEKSYVYCDSVVDNGGALMANPVTSYLWTTYSYDSWEDVQCLGPTATLSGYARNTSRQAAFGGEIFTAWHSAGTIEVYAQAMSFRHKRDIPLEDYNNAIYGISIPDHEQLVLSGRNNELLVFDRDDGSWLDSLPLRDSFTGVACHTP